MQVFERKILILNLLQKQPIQEETFQIGNIRFTTVEHSIGWNFEAAEAIIRDYTVTWMICADRNPQTHRSRETPDPSSRLHPSFAGSDQVFHLCGR